MDEVSSCGSIEHSYLPIHESPKFVRVGQETGARDGELGVTLWGMEELA